MTAFLSQRTRSKKFNSSFGNKMMENFVSCTFEAGLKLSVMIWNTRNKQIFWLRNISFLPRGSVLLWIPSCVRQVNGERRSSISTELTGNYVQTLFYKLWDFWSKIHRSDLFSPYKCLTTSMWFLSQGLTYFAVIVCVCRSSLMY